MSIYHFLVKLYGLLIVILAKTNLIKAQNFLKDRKNLFNEIENALHNEHRPILWFHCASVGEFEQAKPLIEKYFKHTNKAILTTFFSPSAYKNIKTYSYSHYIFPLPLDSEPNAVKFIDIVKPEKVFFIKYDYWPFYFSELYKRRIPIFMISAIFSGNTLNFCIKKVILRLTLKKVEHFFIQNTGSAKQLRKLGFINYSVVGDTRFDRVWEIRKKAIDLEIIRIFLSNESIKKVLIMGSVYVEDIKIFIKFLKLFFKKNACYPYDKVIIVPHEMSEVNAIFNIIRKSVKVCPIKYSLLLNDQETVNSLIYNTNKFLIVDRVGILPYIYQYNRDYCNILKFEAYAYIGGGFNKGVHNCLEAAVFELPIIIGGRHYKKSREVIDLINLKACFNINTARDFIRVYDILSRPNVSMKLSIRKYIAKNIQVSDKIYSYIEKNY